MTRPAWHEYFLAIAQVAAKRSTCSRRQVGAIIVNAELEVRGTGYNGGPRGYRHCTDGGCPRALRAQRETVPTGVQYDDCIAIHAEANALLQTTPSDRRGATLYTTDFPCFGCAKLIANSGVTTVVSGIGTHTDMNRGFDLLTACGIDIMAYDLKDAP